MDLNNQTLAETAAPDAAVQVAEAAPAVPDNILLADWSGPYKGVPPFDKVAP